MLYFYVRHFFDQIFIDLSSAVAVDLSSFDIKDFICQLISKIEQGLSFPYHKGCYFTDF